MSNEFYDLSANDPQGRAVSMERFRGKTLLIVNTATRCGLAPQFGGLEALYQEYKDRGLVVLGFPCNQFRDQEPETNETMEQTCLLNFGVSFPLFEKIEVNGPGTHPVFGFLKKRLGGFLGRRIKWNFTKILISAEGKPLRRWGPVVKPEAMKGYIEKNLGR